MLLKIERTILRKTSSRKGNEISLPEIGNYDGEDVYQTFLGLKELGYFHEVDSCLDYSSFSYVLSAKGRYYKEYIRLQFLKNILIPFVVALITAVCIHHLEKITDEYTNKSTCNTCYELNNTNN